MSSRVKTFIYFFSVLFSFLFMIIYGLNLFLTIYGSKKIPAFMISQYSPQALHPEIDTAQREDAERFFGRYPFMFRGCFEKYINDKSGSKKYKYDCVELLPLKSQPWAMNYLFNCLKNDEWEVRQGAADGLSLYLNNNDEIFSKLSEAWTKEKHEKVEIELAHTLLKYHQRATEVFKTRFNDPDYKIAIIAAVALYGVKFDPVDFERVRSIFRSGDEMTRRFLMVYSWSLLKEKAKPILMLGIKDRTSVVRILAAVSLYGISLSVGDLARVKSLFKHGSIQDKRFLIKNICINLKDKAKPILLLAKNENDPETRDMALKYLAEGHL